MFGKLYKHFGLIDSYIRKNNGTYHDAKDVFQQALMVFYKNCLKPDFELTSSISTYLYSVSKNLWLKEIRKNKNNTTSELPENISEEKGDSEEKEVLIEGMLSALDKLTDNCKKLIKLYHFEKKQWSEIVDLMGYKNAHAARNQKYKCLQKLKMKLS